MSDEADFHIWKSRVAPKFSFGQWSHHFAMCLTLGCQLLLPLVCSGEDLDLLEIRSLKSEWTVSRRKPFERTDGKVTVDSQ